MGQVMIAVMALLGTGLQAWTSLADLRETKPGPIGHWNTEDELVNERPRRERREARRTVRETRNLAMHHEIRRLQAVLASWALLFAAASCGLFVSVVELLSSGT